MPPAQCRCWPTRQAGRADNGFTASAVAGKRLRRRGVIASRGGVTGRIHPRGFPHVAAGSPTCRLVRRVHLCCALNVREYSAEGIAIFRRRYRCRCLISFVCRLETTGPRGLARTHPPDGVIGSTQRAPPVRRRSCIRPAISPDLQVEPRDHVLSLFLLGWQRSCLPIRVGGAIEKAWQMD